MNKKTKLRRKRSEYHSVTDDVSVKPLHLRCPARPTAKPTVKDDCQADCQSRLPSRLTNRQSSRLSKPTAERAPAPSRVSNLPRGLVINCRRHPDYVFIDGNQFRFSSRQVQIEDTSLKKALAQSKSNPNRPVQVQRSVLPA